MFRREFKIRPIRINGRLISEVRIDPHVEKHKEITSELIIELVTELDGIEVLPEKRKDSFEYFVTQLYLGNKNYRLVWLLEDLQIYVGIITAFRDRKKRKP